MTNYTDRPIEPFAVPARVLRTSHGNDSPPPPPAGGESERGVPRGPGGFNFELLDLAAGCVFFALYVLCRTEVMAEAAASVALLAVMLWRLSPRGRGVAGPILAIATVMLVTAITSYYLGPNDPRTTVHATPEELSMPVVVAAALYFTRARCYTLHILTALGAGILVSGLLPAAGWMVCFLAVRYSIFFVVVLGLFLDLMTSLNHKPAAA